MSEQFVAGLPTTATTLWLMFYWVAPMKKSCPMGKRPPESVAGMLEVIAGMGAHSRANFVDFRGEPIEW